MAKRDLDAFCLLWGEDPPPTYSQATKCEWQKKMARVLGGLEVQKGVIEKQQKEFTLAHEETTKLKVENLELPKSIEGLSKSLNQAENEMKDWQQKSEEAMYFVKSEKRKNIRAKM